MVQQEAVIDDRKLSNIRAEYWFRITVLILRSRGTKAFDTDLQVAPPQCTSRRPLFILLCVAKGVTLRCATTAAPLQRVYKFEGFLRLLTITIYGYVMQLEISGNKSKWATVCGTVCSKIRVYCCKLKIWEFHFLLLYL